MNEFTLKTIDNISVTVNITGLHLVLEWRNEDNYAETLHFDSIQTGALYDKLTDDRERERKETKKRLQHAFETSKVGLQYGDDASHKENGTGNYTFREIRVAFEGFLEGRGYDFEEVEGW